MDPRNAHRTRSREPDVNGCPSFVQNDWPAVLLDVTCGRRLRGEPARVGTAQHEDQRRGWRLREIGGAEYVKVLHERGILDLRKFERDRPHFLDRRRSACCRA